MASNPHCLSTVQISTNVLGSICAMLIQSVLTLMAATCVSVGQDMREMDTTVQVSITFTTQVRDLASFL